MTTFRSTLAQNSLLSFALFTSLLLRRYSQCLLRAIAAGMILLSAASAFASTDTVTTLADSGAGSLRATLAAASAGDTIVFSPELTGTITLTNTLTIPTSMTLEGPGPNHLTVSGANQFTVFTVTGTGANISISGLTIANGHGTVGGILGAAGATSAGGGAVTVSNCTFFGNTSTAGAVIEGGPGGGLGGNGGGVMVNNSTFSGNTSTNAVIEGGFGSSGGGGLGGNGGGVTVINSTFSGNTSTNAVIEGGPSGPGISFSNGGGVVVSNNIFSGNTSISGTVIEGGTAGVGGGAAGVAVATNNVFWNNSGGDCSSGCTNTGPVDANPMLAPLGNYGGTTETLLPLPGSAAICAGSAAEVPSGVTSDQREFPLIPSCVDAGAVQTNYLLVSTTADSGSGSLRAALGAANSAGFGDIGFSSGVTGTILLLSPLPALTGQITLLGPGAGNLTLSGGGSTAVGSIFTINSGAQLSLLGLTIANGNSNGPGGGISNNGVLTVTNSSFNDNSSPGDEGGAINSSGTLVVSASSFIGNSSSFGDAGVGGAINNSGVLTVDDSTFSANSSNNGGAICNSDGTATISNSTFSANSSGSAGGGAIFGFGGAVTATNNIFVGNSARVGAGVATSGADSSANLSDNVFFNNLDTGGAEDDCVSCTSNTQAVDADPMLAPLGNYGGPVQTMLPQPGSAAICAGSAALLPMGLTTDQRGFPRTTSYSIAGTPTVCVDAGAVQTNYQSVQFTNVPSSGSYNGVVGIAISNPGPVVSLTENNQSIGGVPIALIFSGASSTVTGLEPATTASGMGASFNGLIITTTGINTLSVNLPITGVGANVQPAALTASAAIDIMEQAQAITFGPLPNQPFGTAAFNVSATASSGLTVIFASTTPTVCTVSGSTVNLVSAGTCTIQATQAGNTTFAAATPVSARFTVTMVAPTISFTVPNQSYGAAAFSVSASSNSTGVLTYTVTSGPATVSGATVTLTGAGTVVLQASEAADANYIATTKNATFNVATGTPTIVFNVPNHSYGDAPFTVSSTSTSTSTSTGAFTYTVVSGPAAIAGSTVTLTGAGTVVLQASQAATANYAAATATTSFTVIAAQAVVPTLSFVSIPAQMYGNAPFAVSATSASSGALIYAVVSGPAIISGSTVTLTGAGTVMLSANQLASGNYAAATATTSFTVAAGFTLLTSGSGTGSTSGTATVARGTAATYTLTLSPQGAATYPDALTLSATGLPAGATATFSPATIAAGSAMTPVTLTIQTSGQTARNEKPSSGRSFAPVALGFLLLPLAGMKSVRRRLRHMPRLTVALAITVLSLGAVLGLSGCGGNDAANQTAKSYTVAVTATDVTTGAHSSTNITLNVQ